MVYSIAMGMNGDLIGLVIYFDLANFDKVANQSLPYLDDITE